MPNEAGRIDTYGGGISFVEMRSITRAMLRFDPQNRCYIEFYADDGRLVAITWDKFLNQEDAKLWMAIRFPKLLTHIM